jgi:cyclopropane fatty-acyl-phospholipid synthase-like methyltransferase
MAEHVGVRRLGGFFRQVYDMLDDDGVFFLQIAGLRKAWQFEDFTWGLFMNKYVFPGADASTPLGFVIDTLEGAGFEVKMVDTIGVHYSATLWRWYRNWLGNKDKVQAKYGKRWYRVSLTSLFTHTPTNIATDLGILPRLLYDRVPSGYCHMLPDHTCQEFERRSPR